MFFICSQLCHQSCQIFKVGCFSPPKSFLPLFAEVMNLCGIMHQHSCCVLGSWGAVSAFLQPPWVFTYARFHKVIKNYRSPKNVKPTKFHPNTDSSWFVSRVWQVLLVTCHSLALGRIFVFYTQTKNAASVLDQAILLPIWRQLIRQQNLCRAGLVTIPETIC